MRERDNSVQLVSHLSKRCPTSAGPAIWVCHVPVSSVMERALGGAANKGKALKFRLLLYFTTTALS